MTNLESLARRVEVAMGPDRELDCLIAVAVSNDPNARVVYYDGIRWHKHPSKGSSPFAGAMGGGTALGVIYQRVAYTGSIDAAMTLADGYFWAITMRGESAGGFSACVQKDGSMAWHDAATPALALAAAALRAIDKAKGTES